MSNEQDRDDKKAPESVPPEGGKPKVRGRRLSTSIRAGIYNSDGSDGGSDTTSAVLDTGNCFSVVRGGDGSDIGGASGASTWSCRASGA